MALKFIFQGAEAVIKSKAKKIIKERSPKLYRYPLLDEKLRVQRNRKEIKLLGKASLLIPVPQVLDSTDYQITLEKIKDKNLASSLNNLSNKAKIGKEIGKSIALLHDSNIIHGDLTTSNMIYSKNKLYLIDFGLGFESEGIEDKAVDLHVLKEALEARHHSFASNMFKAVIQGYKLSKNSSSVISRLKAVEKRGRYKQSY